ncbi:MAG TPA: peptide-methionine (S)-S-oxide reductase MsrA [Nevskiaceae bacterium]|nr:peptide-methionine (S)-S-oxide reductase MsrA [Nevskiaceae bacterium]
MGFGHDHLRIDVAAFPDAAIDLETATASLGPAEVVLAGGCFWCTEAVYRELDGVISVTPGYSGGREDQADYATVCSGATDHAEAIHIVYDPSRVSFGRLLKVFFSVAHDPTQVDRQGNDRGRQYRSVIFYANDEQRRVAQAYVDQLEAAGVFNSPITTRLVPLAGFYVAEAYHQDYAVQHPAQPYIAMVARPKVDKLHHYFPQYTQSRDPARH